MTNIPVKCKLHCHLDVAIWTHLILFWKVFTITLEGICIQVHICN